MKSLCLFLVLVASVYSFESNSNCINGPSYWCKSVQNSKECKAFNHCLQTVWTKHDKYLTTNIDQTQFESPNKCLNCIQCLSTDLRRCAYVNLYKNDITELLLKKVTASSVCTLLRQCGDENEKLIIEPEHHQTSADLPESDKVEVDDILLTNDLRFKCGMHPRNWCDNLKITRRCHAFDYCLVAWSKSGVKYQAKPLLTQIGDVKSQKTCGFCVFVFNKLQSVIQQNATEVEVKEYLEGACNLLPSGDEVKDCLSLLDSYYSEIYIMVRNNIDPGIICRVLGACKDMFLTPVEAETMKVENDEQKEIYTKLAQALKHIKVQVVNEKEAIIKTPLQKTALLNRLTSSPQLQQTSGIGCELCTIVLTAARNLLENKVDDEEILNFVETQLCSRLGKYQNTCVEYVKGEGELILEMLAHQVDPALICRGMGLCLKVQVSDTVVNEQFFDLHVRNALNCTLCKLVVTEVKQMLTNNKKQAEIIEYIDTNLCEKVGRTKELCKSLIEAYGPLFLEIIARDVNPSQLCTMIGMCDKRQMASMSINYIDLKKSRPISKRTETTLVAANTTCVMCEFVLNVISRYIDQNSTEPEIEALLMKVCSEFPSSIKAECSTFVTQYGPIIAALLIKEVESDKICAQINLCPNGQQQQQEITNVNPKQESSKVRDLECTVCEYSIEYLYHQYSVEQTEKQIEFGINNVCKFTPVSYRHYCEKMVTNYGKDLIIFMQKEMSSENVCKQIHMCKSEPVGSLVDLMPAKVVKQKKHFFEESNNVKNGSIECSLCMYVAGLVDAKLMDNKTEEQIVDELKLACNLFPTTLKDQCESFISEYGPYIVQLVAQDLDPHSTCASLNLCETAIHESTIHRLYKNFHKSN